MMIHGGRVILGPFPASILPLVLVGPGGTVEEEAQSAFT